MSDNGAMEKHALRQVLIRKLVQSMTTDPNIETQEKLAARSGLSQSHISRLLLGEASPTVDALEGLAKAMRCQPWELLVDEEEVRRAAIERMLGKELPPPTNVVAIRRKKRRS